MVVLRFIFYFSKTYTFELWEHFLKFADGFNFDDDNNYPKNRNI